MAKMKNEIDQAEKRAKEKKDKSALLQEGGEGERGQHRQA